MAKILPIFLAVIFSFTSQCFVLNHHVDGLRSMWGLYVIRVALYFLLLDLPLYLKSLRRIHTIPENILQFVLGLFIIETAISYIWYPVENAVFCLATYLMKSFLRYYLYNASDTFYYASCLTSLFILAFILHATRAVDFGILRQCGTSEFFEDVFFRFKRGLRAMTRMTRGRTAYGYGYKKKKRRTFY